MTNALECVAAGKCAIVTNLHYYGTFGLLIGFGLLLVVLIMFIMWTPALTFLKAKLNREKLFIQLDGTNAATFKRATSKESGLVNIKGIGNVQLEENSHMFEKKSGLFMFLWRKEIATTIPIEFLEILKSLKKRGVKIRNEKEYKLAIAEMDTELLQTLLENENLEEKERKAIEELLKRAEKEKLVVNKKTIPIPDLKNMFPYTINPLLFETQKEAEVQKHNALTGRMEFKHVMMFAIIIIVAVLAFVIVFKFLKTPDCPAVQVACEAAKGGVKTIVSNFTA